MALGGLGLFLLEAGTGTALLLLFFPAKTLGKGFFSLHGALACAFLAGAYLAGPRAIPGGRGGGCRAACRLHGACPGGEGRPGAADPGPGGGGRRLGAARERPWPPRGPTGTPGRWRGHSWEASSSAPCLLTMNLGHWYLVSRSLPFSLLARGAALFAALAAGAGRFCWRPPSPPTRTRPGSPRCCPSSGTRSSSSSACSWGIVGPLALSYFIWKTADMQSNQAATGLLYVALVFVLIGELLSSYLTVATGFPA